LRAALLLMIAVTTMPQVWIDRGAGVYHSPKCPLISAQMPRMARSLAKMQKMTPAPECAVSDAEATRVWNELVAKKDPVTEARPGGFSQMSGTGRDLPATPKSAPPVKPKASKPAPVTWNDVMKASDFYEADRVMARTCQSQSHGDPKRFDQCVQKQAEAVATLKSGKPFGADEQRFNEARVRCANQWPHDYRKRLRCEGKSY
jgi:hypothetical protein